MTYPQPGLGRSSTQQATQVIFWREMWRDLLRLPCWMWRQVKAVIFTYTNMATEIHGHGETEAWPLWEWPTAVDVLPVKKLCSILTNINSWQSSRRSHKKHFGTSRKQESWLRQWTFWKLEYPGDDVITRMISRILSLKLQQVLPKRVSTNKRVAKKIHLHCTPSGWCWLSSLHYSSRPWQSQ
jgi:hypothetical protein